MALERLRRRLRNRKLAGKNPSPKNAASSAFANPLPGAFGHNIERLETRLLMSADPLHFVAPGAGRDLTLSLVDKAGIPTIEILDTASSTILAQEAESAVSSVGILLKQADTIRVSNDFSSIAPVTVTGQANDKLVGPSLAAGAAYTITGVDAGQVAGVSFSKISKLQGADSSINSFLFNPGGVLSGGIDGGVGGANTLTGPSSGASFTLAAADSGAVKEIGATAATSFTNIGSLQGGAGADNFQIAAGASLSVGLDGGGGVNAVSGPSSGATFAVTGADAGTAAGVTFAHIGQLKGGAGADVFEIGAGASLSVGVDGGAGANTLAGPDSGATFTIAGRDSGQIGGLTFTHIGQIQGASNAPDIFVIEAGGSLSGGIDGGAGGGNALVGPDTGALFSISGADSGALRESGALYATNFNHIGNLQGGSGADNFQLAGGATLSDGIDGGGGANTLTGPAASSSYYVTGADAGVAAGVAFSHIGKLQARGAADTFEIDDGASLSIGLDGGSGANSLTGPASGASFILTGRNSGMVDGTAFANIGKLKGADGASDIFTIDAGGSLSAGLDGGVGGDNELIGPDTGATFTVSSADGGVIKETGAVFSTTFTNIGQLQGGTGDDKFVLASGGSLSIGIDGGGGANNLHGPSGATYTISGGDAGDVNGTQFSHIGKLIGTNNAADVFVLSNGASLSAGIDGVGAAHNRLIGPSEGASFNITGRNAGSAPGVAFVSVGKIVGADGAADAFVFGPGGSLVGGVDGGAGGGNSIFGPSTGATFTVSTLDGGTIRETGSPYATAFSDVGRLVGADQVSDLFLIQGAGALSTGLSGGAAGPDSLRLTGTVNTAIYSARGTQSGLYELDGRQIAFDGIETIDDQLTAANRVVNGTDGADILTVTESGSRVTVSAPTIDPISFNIPGTSLTVNGAGGIDSILVGSDLRLPNVAFTLAAESVADMGYKVDTSGGTNGAITFFAQGLDTTMTGSVDGIVSGALGGAAAAIVVDGATLKAGGALTLLAQDDYANDVNAQTVAAQAVAETATITISGSSFSTPGVVDIAATTSAELSDVATGAASSSASGDAAAAVTLFTLTPDVSIAGSTISAGRTLDVAAASTVQATTRADASVSSAGGASADLVGNVAVGVTIDGTSALSAGAGYGVSVTASSTTDLSTTALASPGGVSGATPRTGALLANPDASTSEGAVTAAAAVAVNVLNSAVAVTLDGAAAIIAPAGLTFASNDTHDVNATADASATSTSTGIAAAVAINSVTASSDATALGKLTFTGSQATIAANETSGVTATAISGIGSASATGVAGALAVNDVNVHPDAEVASSAALHFNGADLTISALIASSATANASAAVGGGGEAVGVGASVALNFTQDPVDAVLAGVVTGAHDIHLAGTGQDTIATTASGGVAGGTAVTPVVAMSSASNKTNVSLASGPAMAVSGSVELDLDRRQTDTTTADASAAGGQAAVGAALALAFNFNDARAQIERSVTARGVTVSASAGASDATRSTASASGVDGADARGDSGGQMGHEIGFEQSRTGNAAPTPDPKTSSGGFGLAAALALNSQQDAVTADIAAGVSIVAIGGAGVLVQALSDHDASATADASVVKAGAVGIGAALAINDLSPHTTAEIDGAVKSDNVVVQTGQANDTPSPGFNTLLAEAISGAGAQSLATSGALGLNLDNLSSSALVAKGASVIGAATGGLLIIAVQRTDTTTIGTADGSAGDGGGVGIGAGVALTIANENVSAVVDGLATVATGSGALTLTAISADAIHGDAQAGAASGAVGVAPSTFIVIAENATLAELPAGATLSLKGSVSLEAEHKLTIDGAASSAGGGADAGVGASFTLAIVEDKTQALVERSISAAGPVSVLASNVVNAALNSTASAAGAPAGGTSDGQIGQQLSFANGQSGGAPASAHNAEVPDANGAAQEVGAAAAISLAILDDAALALIAKNVTIVTPGAVTVEADSASSQSVTADASKVDKSQPDVGVGAAVALNTANAATTAEVDGNITSGGLAIRALQAPNLASNVVATAISGAGAGDVGVAGAFAANFSALKNNAILTTSAVEQGHGAVEIRSEITEFPRAVATSSESAAMNGQSGGGDAVGIGAAVALNILTNVSSAALPDAVTVTGAGNLTVAASDAIVAKTWAVAGSTGGDVGVSPDLALFDAQNKTSAIVGKGPALSIAGSFTLAVTDDATDDARADAAAAGASSVGIGASIALNILEDVADASPSRAIIAGLDVNVTADLVADASGKAVAAASGVSSQGGPTTTDGESSAITGFANHESGASTSAPQVAKANGGGGDESSVGVSAALALNVVNTHARASLSGAITVSSGRDVTVAARLDVDGEASADASTVKQQTGIGAGVALNVINADNSAQIVAKTVAGRSVTVSATQSPNGDGVDTFLAEAHSGAGASDVGVAGAAAFNLLNLPTTAQILTSLVAGGGGQVTIAAANRSTTTTIASSKATAQGQAGGSSGVGVGASFALSLINLPTHAELPDNITATGAGGLSITADGEHSAVTTAEAGTAGNVAVSPAVAITISGSDTTARLGAGPQMTALGAGGVTISAHHAGNYQTTADAQAGGDDVAVGAAIALGLTFEQASATTSRSIDAAGDVRIEAIDAIASGASATGGAKGESTGGGDADKQAQLTLDNNSNVAGDSAVKAQPGGQIVLPKAADQDASASQTAAGQASGRGAGGVGVAAAVGVNIVTTGATASVPKGLFIRSRGGEISVDTQLQVDGSAKAIGTSILDSQKDDSVGAGVALNVITATNSATVGDKATLSAANGVTVAATMAPRAGDNSLNDFVVESAAAAGAQKYGVAGAVSIDVISLTTIASLGQSDNVNAGAGAVTVAAQADNRAENLAGSGAFGSDAGVGAALVFQDATIVTDAIVHQNAAVDGAGGVSVTSETSYTPEPDNFKGLGFALTSGAFGGAGSDDGAAFGGSVNVNVLNFDTEARLDQSVNVNQRAAATGDVIVSASSTVTLFSGAGGVGVALGDVGIGFGLDLTIVNQKTLADVANGSHISTGGNVAVEAQSSDRQTSVAGSFGLTSKSGGAGSVAVNLFNLGSDPLAGTRAIVGANSVIQAGGGVSVFASNPYLAGGGLVHDSLTIIAGAVAGAGETAVGIADANALRNDWFYASVGDGSNITTGGGLNIDAEGALDLALYAAAGAGGLEYGVAGSLTVSTLDEEAQATIGRNVTIVGTTSLANVSVTAADETSIVKVAGAVGFGEDVGVGAGLDVGVLTKNTIASIGAHSQIDTGGSVSVFAYSSQNTDAYSASGAGGSEAAVAGSVGVQVENVTTRAFIEGTTSGAATNVFADGNVFVQAEAADQLNLFAGGLSLSGDVAVGASAPIPIINKTTEAYIGQNASVVGLGLDGVGSVLSGDSAVSFADPSSSGPPSVTTTLTGDFTFPLSGGVSSTPGVSGGASPTIGDPNAGKIKQVTDGTVQISGVAVVATNIDNIGVLSLTGGGSGSVAVSVAGVVEVANISTTAHVDKGASINQAGGAGAGQDVLVAAGEDFRSLIVSGAAAIGGDVAVAPSVGVLNLNLTTLALIAGTDAVSAADSVGVKARASEDIQSVVVGVGGSGTASVAGSPSILLLTDNVAAHIGDIAAGKPDVAATVEAGGSVVVQALDDTSVLDSDGSLGIGGDAGLGAGVAINIISKNTSAQVAAGSIVDAAADSDAAGVAGIGGVDSRFDPAGTDAGLIVVAGTSEYVGSAAIAGSGGIVGGSGAVNLNLISSSTIASIGDGARINQNLPGSSAQDVIVGASNDVLAVAVTGSLGVGGVGVAGSLGIGVVHNSTQALIGNNVALTAQNLVSVTADSQQSITAVDVSGGVASGFGGALSFGTWVLNSAYTAGGGAASESSWASTYQSTLTGGALGGFQGALSGYRQITIGAADVVGATINLKTSTLQTGDAVIYHSSGPGASGNLVDGQTYYLIKTGATTYELASSLANADAGIAIAIGAVKGGAFELADDARSDAGLTAARDGLIGGAPKASLSTSLSAAPGGTVAFIGTGGSIYAGGGLNVEASNHLNFVQVAGQVAASGNVGVGGAFATLIDNETVLAQIAEGAVIAVGGVGLAVQATTSQNVTQIAAGAGVAGSASVSGSGTVTLLNETTNASLGNNEQVTGTISAAGVDPDVKVLANDATTVVDVAGAIGFGGSAAVGAGADVVILTKNTLATIGVNDQITTQGSVELRAHSTDDVTSVAAIGQASGNAAVSISASVVVANITTEALVAASPTTTIDADGNVILEAVATSDYNLWGIAASLAGTAAVSGAAAVPVISKTVLAEIGDGATVSGRGLRNGTSVADGSFGQTIGSSPTDVTSSQAGGGSAGLGSPDYSGANNDASTDKRQGYDANQNYSGDPDAGSATATPDMRNGFTGVAVTATNTDKIGSTGLSLGAAGTVAVSLAGAVQVVNASVQARIGEGANIDTLGAGAADQSVLVAAGEDFRSLNIAGGASLAGAVAVTPVAAVQNVNLNTSAIIDAGANVNAGDTVLVSAHAFEKVTEVAASVAAAAFAGVSVAPNVMVLNSQTVASIGGSGQATVNAGGSVGVLADDESQFTNVAASFGVGFAGLSIGGDVVIVTKNTQALVTDGSSITANAAGSQINGVLDDLGSAAQNNAVEYRYGAVGGVVVQAVSSENVTDVAGAVAVGAVGLGITGNIIVVNSDTVARIGAGDVVNSGGAVIVGAANSFDAFALAGAAAGGVGAAGGALTVGDVHNGVSASIGDGANITSGSDMQVIALSHKAVDSFDIAGSLGGIALTGSIGVWTFGGSASGSYSYQDRDGQGNDAGGKSGDALGSGASGWNSDFDADASGSKAPGGSYGSILNGQSSGGGNSSRLAAADTAARAQVAAAKPKTTVTAQLNGEAGDTTASIGQNVRVHSSGGVLVRANDSTSVTQTAGAFSAGVLSAGAPISITTLNGSVSAVIGAGDTIFAVGDINVEAGQTRGFDGFVFAGQGGLGAIGAQILIVNDNGFDVAQVAAGANLFAFGNIGVNATSKQTYSGGAFGATLAAVGAGASVAIVNVGGSVQALMDAASVTAYGTISVVATDDAQVGLQSFGVGVAGLGAISGAIAVADVSRAVSAHISDGTTTTAIGDVTVSAVDLAGANVSAYAISIAAGAGLGVAVADAEVTPSVTAQVGGTINVGGTLTTLADFNTDSLGNKIGGRGAVSEAFSVGAALVAGVAGAVSISNTDVTILARIDDGATIDPFSAGFSIANVVVRSLSGADAIASAQGIGVGLLAGLGASVATANVRGSNTALATGANLLLGSGTGDRLGDVTIDARSADNASADTLAASGGIYLGFAINLANADVETHVQAEFGAGAQLFANSLTVNAGESGGSHAKSMGVAVSGVYGGAASQANATFNAPVDATVDGATIDALNALNIVATTGRASTDATAIATAVGLLVGVNVNSATATTHGATLAVLENATVVGNPNNRVRIHAGAVSDAQSRSAGAGFGLLGVGSTEANTVNDDGAEARIGDSVQIGRQYNQDQGDFGASTVQSIEVSATSVGTGAVNVAGAAAGIATVPIVKGQISVTPFAHAYVGANAGLYASGDVNVTASNLAEGDGSLAGRTVSAIDFGSMELDHKVTQDAEAIVFAGATIYGDNVSILATGGDPSMIVQGYDGVSTVTGGGFSIGLFADSNALAQANVTSTVIAQIQNGSTDSPTVIDAAGSLSVLANATVGAAAKADDSSTDLLGKLSTTTVNAFITGTTEALIGFTDHDAGSSSLTTNSGGVTFVEANATLNADANNHDDGAGLFDSAESDAQASSFYTTLAGFGEGVGAVAGSVVVNANTTHVETTEINNTATGVVSVANAGGSNSGSFAKPGSVSGVIVGGDTQVYTMGSLDISATISNSRLQATSVSNAENVVGKSEATATAIGDDQVKITLASGSIIVGLNGVNISAGVNNYEVDTSAVGNGGNDVSFASSDNNNWANTGIVIDAQAGAKVVAGLQGSTPGIALEVATNLNVIRSQFGVTNVSGLTGKDTFNGRDKGDIGHKVNGVTEDDGSSYGDNSEAIVNWNADVTLDKVYIEKDLVIDQNGIVSVDSGIPVGITIPLPFPPYGLFFLLPSAVGFQAGPVIYVGDITSESGANYARFDATQNNITKYPDGNQGVETQDGSDRNLITGTAGNWQIQEGVSLISIVNNSSDPMQIHNIETIPQGIDLATNNVFINIRDAAGGAPGLSNSDIPDPSGGYSPFNFSIGPVYGSASVQISNHTIQPGSGDILLEGTIDNPLGSTYVDAGGGSIVQDNIGGVIRSRNIVLSAGGDIGEPNFPGPKIKIALAPDAAVPAALPFSGVRGAGNPINIELVESDGQIPTLEAFAGGSIALDITTRLRDPDVSSSTAYIEDLYSSSHETIQVTFHQAAWDIFVPSTAPDGIVVAAVKSPHNDPAGISTPAYYRNHYYPTSPFGTSSGDAYAAFGQNFGFFTAHATYDVAFGQSVDFGYAGYTTYGYGEQSSVTINLLSGSTPFAASPASLPLDEAPAPSARSDDADSVTLSVPSVATAEETPIEDLLGEARTAFFGVSEADFVALAAAAAQRPPVNLLEEDFMELDPGLITAAEFSNPAIQWS